MPARDAGDGREETPHEAQRLSTTRLFLIVVVFLILAVYSIWNSDRFQTLLQGVSEQRLSDLLQRKVAFRRVDFHIFPPSIALADVRIDNDPRLGGEPLLSAAELTIGGGLSVTGGELRLGRVRAVAPRIALVQFEDGTWNLPPGLTGKAEKGGLTVRIGELVVQRGIFQFDGRESGLDARLDDFAFELSALGPERYGGTLACRRVQLDLPSAEPLLFGLDLRFRLDSRHGATVDALRLVGEFGELSASGAVENFKDPVILLKTRGDLRIAEVERIFHSGLGFTGDARVRADLRYPTTGPFRITGRISSAGIDAKGFPLEDLEASVTAEASALVARIEKARYAGGLANGVLRIENLGGHGAAPMTLGIEARGVSVERFFADIRLPGTGLSGQAAISASLHWAEGGLERADGAATISIDPGPAASMVRGRFGIPIGGGGVLPVVGGRIGFEGATFRFPATTLRLTGGMRIGQWTPDFDFELQSRDLAEVDRLFQNFTAASGGAPDPLGLGGSGDIEGHIARSWGDPEVTARISTENTRYANVTFGSVRGAADMADGAFFFHPLRVYDGSATISLEGTARYRHDPARPRLDLTATAKDYPIERLLDYLDLDYPITGRVSGDFPLKGNPPDGISGGGAMVLENAVVWGQPVPRATARATLVPGRFELDEVRAELSGGTLGGRGAIDLHDKTFEVRAAADGVPIEELVAVRDVSTDLTGKLSFELTGSGAFDRPDLAVSASLEGARFHGREIPAALAPTLEARMKRGELTGTLSAPGHWTLQARGEPFGSPGRLDVELDAPDVAGFVLFTPLELPEGVGGAITASGRFTWPEEKGASVTGEVTVSQARLDTKDHPGLFQAAEPVRIRIAEKRITLDNLHAVGEGMNFTVHGALIGGGPSEGIEGRVTGTADAALLDLVQPGIGLTGRLLLDVGASGTLDAPAFNGTVRIENGRYRTAGYSFDDIEGTLRLVGSSGEIEGLRARVADGEAFAAGSFRLAGRGLESYRLSLQGRRISVRAIPALRLVVDADLVLTGGAEEREVRGEITLLRGSYTKDVDLTVSDLLSSRRGGAIAAREPWKERTALDVRIVSAAALEVRNNVARLSGTVDLTVRGTLQEPIFLGQVLLDEGGRVVFSDVRYEIENGAITFSNTTRVAPFVDLRARAEIKGYDLVVSLVGTWPRVTANFTSDPPLSNDAILGLVLSGTPPDTRNESRTTDQLVSAAGGIVSGAVTGGLTRRTQQIFKLDRFQIDPVFEGSNLSTVRTTIGKQITQDLSVTSSIALDSSKEPIVRIEWQATDSILVQLLRDENGNYSLTFRRRQRL